jgi:group I intron endonuclease
MVERHIYGYRWKKTGAYVYIGSAFDVAERDREHRKQTEIPFDRFMAKHGWDNFELVVLETVHGKTKVDCGLTAVPREDYWMDQKKTWHKFEMGGMNYLRARVMWLNEAFYEAQCAAISQGQRRAWTSERKKRFGESQIGNAHFQGHQHPEGWRAATAARQAGEGNSFAGKHHSSETREQMSLRRRGEGNAFFRKTHTQETKDKIGKANSLLVMEENKQEVIRRYEEGQSMAMVAEWAGTNASTILRYFRVWGIKTRSLSEAQLIRLRRRT